MVSLCDRLEVFYDGGVYNYYVVVEMLWGFEFLLAKGAFAASIIGFRFGWIT